MRRLSRRELLLGTGGVLLASSTIAGVAQAQGADEFQLVERELTVDGLDPAHDGLRVAQISDLHIGASTPDGRIIAAVRTINSLNPDLVFLTGDFVTFSRAPLPRVAWLLEGIKAPAFSVLGNHDHWVAADEVARDVEKQGYAMLRNQWTSIELRGAKAHIFGIDDGRTRHDDVAKTFSGAPTRGTRLVMAHTPMTAKKLPARQGLLCFSGHTHGGQIQLPGLTNALAGIVGERYVRGLYQVNGNQLYVNSGLGYGKGGPAVRIGVPPELTLMTLRARAA